MKWLIAFMLVLFIGSAIYGGRLLNKSDVGVHHLQHVTWVGNGGSRQYGSYYGVIYNVTDDYLAVVPLYCVERRGRLVRTYPGELFRDSSMDSAVTHIKPHGSAFFWVETADTIPAEMWDQFITYMQFETESFWTPIMEREEK